MSELMNELEKLLQKENFSESDIKKIFSSIVFVSYSPYKFVDAEINNICVAPIYDTVGSTKLAYEKLKESRDVVCSNPEFSFKSLEKFKFETYSEFLELYKCFMNNEDVLYFMNNNTFVATPNLLFDDGIKEDHNLTGAINYSRKTPYQTNAGILTSLLLTFIFKYILSNKKKNVSFKEIYKQAIKEAEMHKQNSKEL